MDLPESLPRIHYYVLHGADPHTLSKDSFDVYTPVHLDEYEDNLCFQWDIDTKYYKASTLVCFINVGDLSSNTSPVALKEDLCEAVVIYADSTNDRAFEDVKELVEKVGNYQPEVKLLLCENCPTDGVSFNRDDVMQWCISGGWELIELHPKDEEPLTEDTENDPFSLDEEYGVKRLRNALYAHTWSNLEMKDRNHSHSEDISDLDNFTRLFSSITHCRNTNMSHEDRKRRAEEITMDFWKFCGGSSDEVDGSDSD